jgi:hypothetical protein
MATQSKLSIADFILGSPLFLGAAAFFFILSFVRFLLDRPKKLDLPIVGEPNEKDHRKYLIEGTTKVGFPCIPIQSSSFLIDVRIVPRQPLHNSNGTATCGTPNIRN